ncbi:ABC transporter ATP-binding protein [Erwinia pyrifoliae]|uniref:ATP-binding cassette domain-containing protein n=1 Tax=Erwinia pyrifoliae TaxID=79967 RepID=A0ABY5XBU6_ERWPY|nr:ATP-binding cassette domain-containing protein [Erwinia pyrifoliae]AUX73019.1 ABC transporter ATP-binding protein [Erwinia pyrifoliae]MCA8876703.1 ABC transporter ATP-binding protein [Erwinia pyrifoliae]UWS31386.1 ATP-binding cassette domain-containing protein [Erwinia pyrifoliae]UWS34809.1 ATP-binding cassette domain-containing protein [Erwinia pyrifoliae]UXK10960.1 ATP-binding cassette domain-containing protein [Erwinia pyrifoliae]
MMLMDIVQAAVSGGEMNVQPLSFTLHAGRPFTLLGESGSGKSLLAQAVTGTLPDGLQASGALNVNGQRHDLASRPARSLWGHTLGILPQEPWLALDPIMRAGDQVAESYRFLRGMTAARARALAINDLQALGVEQAANKLPQALSGGMAQRVAFAAVRAGGAQIIVADEPTKGLDVARRDEVITLLLRAVQAGGGLFTITHDIELARQLGGELAIMRQGEIVERGSAQQVLTRPQHPYTQALLAADPTRWPVRETAVHHRQVVLEAHNLSKKRGGCQLFSRQSLCVHAGEVIGITGPSGCGKSSFGDILLGLLAADSGEVVRDPLQAAVRYQKIFQDPPSAFAPHARLRQALDDVVRRHRLDGQRIGQLMERLQISPLLLDRYPKEISGGELQRFALLRVLLLDPVFLFADEPTSRLDLLTQQQTIELLVEVAAEQNCALLIVSHDEALIDRISHRRIRLGAEQVLKRAGDQRA